MKGNDIARTLGAPAAFFIAKGKRLNLKLGDLIAGFIGIAVAVLIFVIVIMINRSAVPLRPQTATIDSPWIPVTVKHWEPQIDAMAKKYNIDPNFLAIIMTLESGGDPKANSGQATGLMQITPATATDIARKYLKVPVSKYDLYDPNTSIEFGAAYLNLLRNTFGDYTQAPSYNLTAEAVGAGYNGGPGAANNLLAGKGLTDEQTVLYSRNVFYFWRERHAAKSPAYLRWRDESGGIRLIQAAEKNQKK
jgi:soluble lytic murein transglycosylase-like protein